MRISSRTYRFLVAASLLLLAPLGAFAEAEKAPPPPPEIHAGSVVSLGTTTPLRYAVVGDVTLVALADLMPILGGSAPTVADGVATSRVKIGRATWGFTTDAAIATQDARLVALTARPVAVGGSLFVPIRFVLDELVGGFEAKWTEAEHQLELTPRARPEVKVQVSVVHTEGRTRTVLTFSRPVAYRAQKAADRCLLELDDIDVKKPWSRDEATDPIVAKVALAGAVATIEYRPGEWQTEVYELASPFRVVVETHASAHGLGSIRISGDRITTAPAELATIHTIVIDPGHGGTEVGALGPSGSMEKDLTLEIARALAERLGAGERYKVFLTRQEDRLLPLEDRPAFANHHKADLFLSIHLNASPSPAPRGSETYFLSLSATDEATRLLADSENRAASSTSKAFEDDLDFVLWDLVQNEHVRESARLAEAVQVELEALLGTEARGVKQAPFRVLVGAAMPAILVEVGFVTNPDEEKSLLSPEFRGRVADAIVSGIEAYRRGFERRAARLGDAPVGSP